MNKALARLAETLLIAAVIVGAMCVAVMRHTNGTFVNDNVTSDVIYSDGASAHFDGREFGEVNRGDVVTVRLTLPREPVCENPVLAFYIYHSVSEVWFGDRLLDSYGADIAARGDMVGNHRFLTVLPDDVWGGELTIVLRVTENNAFHRVRDFRIYEARDAYEYYIDTDPVGFCVAFPMLLLGFCVLFVILVNGTFDSTSRKAMYLALFAILSSLWIIGSEGMQSLFGLGGYFASIQEFIAVFTMVIPMLLYAYETEADGAFRTVLKYVLIVTGAFVAVCTVLNFTNAVHYCATLLLSNLLTFAGGVLLLVFAIRQRRSGSRAGAVFFDGMVIMFSCGLIKILLFNGYKYIPWMNRTELISVLPVGVLLFLVYLVRSYVYESTERHTRNIEMQLKAGELRRMVTTIPAGICVFRADERFTVLSANDMFYSITGYPREAAGSSLLDCLGDADRQALKSSVEARKSDGSHFGEMELTLNSPDGSAHTLLGKYNYDSAAEQVTVSIIDITDRKKMEEELRLGEERYKLALSQSGKVFFFFDVPTRTMRLSRELADAFGLPLEVDNMPENFISKGLVERESVENYRSFYSRILAGEESGDTVISCHMRQTPENILWYRIAFTSIFDADGRPMSTIITYEDINAQYQSELDNLWKQLNLAAVSDNSYVIAVYDLERNRLLSQSGGLFLSFPGFDTSYDGIGDLALEHFIHPEDAEALARFLDRTRLLELYRAGRSEETIEYRSLQNTSSYRWTSLSIQMIEDPYSKHIMAQLLFLDINEQKSGEIAMKRNMEELQRELDNSRIKVMINQMQPHFLYNALSAIQTIVKVDPDYAYSLIYDFTVHLRSSIKALSSDEPIPFEDELKNIRAYLNIEQMRFGDVLKVNYDIECRDFQVIPLSIQPLAENAARHGVYPRGEDGGTITIRSRETPEAYVVEVLDDGEGFDVNEVLNRQSDSIGLKNLIFRAKSLMDADVTVSSRPGAGTRVSVVIPKKGSIIREDAERKRAVGEVSG